MPRGKKEIDKVIEQAKEANADDISSMPLKSLEDYMRYNAKARQANHKLGVRRYEIKPCPAKLHPQETVVFGRADGQPNNELPVHISDDMIDFDMKLKPGKTYTLPVYVIDYLSKKGYPEWKWFTNSDGSKETRIDHKNPRFTIRTVHA
jgi:hypothetical protein